MEGMRTHACRIYVVSPGRLLIKQTVKSGQEKNDPYVIDGYKEAHVALDDDKAIADAIRAACAGELT